MRSLCVAHARQAVAEPLTVADEQDRIVNVTLGSFDWVFNMTYAIPMTAARKTRR